MSKLWERVKMAFSEFTSNKDMTVQAEQIEEGRNIITTNGPVYAEEGEWEVRSPDGNVQKYSDEAFQKEFMGGGGEEPTAQKSLYEDDSAESSTKESSTEDTTGVDSGQDSSDTPTKDSDRDSPKEGDGSESDTSAESGTTDTEKDTSKSKSTDPLL
jgi:hypothetical protein